MTRNEAIREACGVFSLAFHSIGDYSRPTDGFCDECPAAKWGDWNYQNAGEVFAYVRKAVVAALLRDGYTIDDGFNADGTERRKVDAPSGQEENR